MAQSLSESDWGIMSINARHYVEESFNPVTLGNVVWQVLTCCDVDCVTAKPQQEAIL
jgi:hypothetical protein